MVIYLSREKSNPFYFPINYFFSLGIFDSEIITARIWPQMLITKSTLFSARGILGGKLGVQFSKASQKKMKMALREFYRKVHPDVLYQAPERVIEENTQSLKSLNNYINALEDNEGAKSQKLRFYSPEKTTRKNKKYIFFELHLNPFKHNSDTTEIDVAQQR